MGRVDVHHRDRGRRRARLLTWAGIAGALGLSGAFSTAAAATFSGKQATAPPRPPAVPRLATPVQHPPPPPVIVEQVVHHASRQAYPNPGAAMAPAPPRQGPVPAPPPPPPPACVSTPSHPC